ncbi:MAG: ATP-binding protein [Planctomycetota bacterium]
MLILTIIEGPDVGRRFELPETEPQLLGRSSEALPIGDTTVSRRHAELTPDDGAWFVRDLESQNGTYVNGHAAEDRVRLSEGDTIRVGTTVLRFGDVIDHHEDAVKVVRSREMDVAVEHTLPADAPLASPDPNEDSVIMAEPEPALAAAEHLRVIYDLTSLTARAADRRSLLDAVLDLVFREFTPERGFIMVRDPKNPQGPLKAAVVRQAGLAIDPDQAKIQVSKTILSHATKGQEGVLSTNAMNDPRFQAGDSVQSFNVRSAICSPITYRGDTYGAVYVDSTMANYTFTRGQLALMNAVGRHTGLALANMDLVSEKLHAERLAAVGETVASLSHSIKNILQGLRGGADIVEMGLKKGDLKTSLGGWDILKRNLNRIIALTLNMLAYSRQRVVEPELVSIGSFLEECAQLFEKQTGEKDVILIVDADPELPPVPLDAHLMHQAMMNLIGNAVDASPRGGAVTVRARYETDETPIGIASAHAIIEVIDQGPGVPEGKRRWIFEPFHTTKGLKGTGLGLAVTKRVIDDHNGSIEVDAAPGGDPGEGVGAIFRVRLPVDTPEALDPSATTDTTARRSEP